MELLKDRIHTSVLKASKYSQHTMDDDFNLPESKGDIEKIITKDGRVVTEEVIVESGKVRILGTVFFKVLYKVAESDKEVDCYEGEMPFEDTINIDEAEKSSRCEATSRLEDLSINMINSRKLEARGLVGNSASIYEQIITDGAVELANGKGVECQHKSMPVTETLVNKRDMIRIKEEIEIPSSKPNIKEIIWSSFALRNTETKPLDEKLNVRGEIEMFVIYRGEEEHLPIQYVSITRSFSKDVQCSNAKEGMIMEAILELGKGDVSIRPDADGEERVILFDFNVDMNIKVYEDRELRLLGDMYSPTVDIQIATEPFCYENLLMRNNAKARIVHREKISDNAPRILQLSLINGDVEIDEINPGEGGVQVQGSINVCVLYVATANEPMASYETTIPFEYMVETVPLCKEDSIRITPCIDQLGVLLLNSEEIEIKAEVCLSITIFSRGESKVITDMQIAPIDYERKAEMPGIIGYIVRPGDTLWSVARNNYATTESIREINSLDNDNLREGDKLIIVKS